MMPFKRQQHFTVFVLLMLNCSKPQHGLFFGEQYVSTESLSAAGFLWGQQNHFKFCRYRICICSVNGTLCTNTKYAFKRTGLMLCNLCYADCSLSKLLHRMHEG